MTHSIFEIEAILRKELCQFCAEWQPNATCGLRAPDVCQLNQRIPKVAKALLAVRKDSNGCFQAIREELCSTCPRPGPDGSCDFRDQVPSAMVIATLLQPLSTLHAEQGAQEQNLSYVVAALERAIDAACLHRSL